MGMGIVHVGCVGASGQKMAPGAEWRYKNFFVRCISRTGGLRYQPVACADENGGKLSPGGKFRRGGLMYRCQITGYSARIVLAKR